MLATSEMSRRNGEGHVLMMLLAVVRAVELSIEMGKALFTSAVEPRYAAGRDRNSIHQESDVRIHSTHALSHLITILI